ncbi:MAG TPA: hypothetical protein VGZ29_00660 [Terriglobia bacterium]|nr:hypothetical protein [Terriglobia bacterium]
MALAESEYDESLQASERLRSATDDVISYLESGNHHQPTHDKLWQQMEEAREEFWALRSRRNSKASPENGNSAIGAGSGGAGDSAN